MYFRNYRLSKNWLDHSLKSTVSERRSKVNMLKSPKHLSNLHQSTFIIFFYDYEEKWFAKHFLYWCLKSYGCLLTHGLPITFILFEIVRISRSLFKWNYLKNQKKFLSVLFCLWNLHLIWTFSKKRWSSQLMYFRNYRLSKTWIDHSLKRASSEHPSTINMLKGPKHLKNIHESTFIRFSHHFEGKWFGKYLPYLSFKT